MANSFVVDAGLRAVPLARLLDVRNELRVRGNLAGEGPPRSEERPVLGGNDALAVGTLYPSSNHPTRRYYLPQYRVLTDGSGKPQVSIRYQRSEGEIGRLTIALTWTPMTAPSASCVVMDHVAQLKLQTMIPVEGGGGIESAIPLQPLLITGADRAESTTIFTDQATFESVYLAMREVARRTRLEITISAEVGVRTWRQRLVVKPTVGLQAATFQARRALFTRTGVEPRPANGPPMEVRREAALATLLARPGASPLLAAPGVTMMARAAAPSGPSAAPGAGVAVASASPRTTGMLAAHAVLLARAPIHGLRGRTIALDAAVAQPALTASPPPAVAVAQPVGRLARPLPIKLTELRPDMSKIAMLNALPLKEAMNKSDLVINGVKAVPPLVALDENRIPAQVDTRLECEVELPFMFDPADARNDAVYLDAGFAGAGIHILRRMALPDTNYAAFRDSLMPDVVLLPPSEFRLARDDTAPYLPSISFLPSDFDTAETTGAGGAEATKPLFRIAVVYRLVPWIDPQLDDIVRVELAREGRVAQLLAMVPRAASLRLDFSALADEQLRTTATVDPALGVSDTLDLDESSFTKLWIEHLTPQAGSLRGEVEYDLFDGTRARIPVRLSLREPSTQVFQVDFVGAVDGEAGRYRVNVRNRIESPVIITELPGIELGPGVVAHAIEPQNHTHLTLAPQESRTIDYRVLPPTEGVLDLRPTVIGTPVPDVGRLFTLLSVTTGFGSRSFALNVRAAPGAFSAPAGGGLPLTGLQVEFDDGTRVTLSPSRPEAEVTVMGRLLDRLQGVPDGDKRYFFRVTNLHANGEGARTKWEERHGDVLLEVGTASGGMNLDF